MSFLKKTGLLFIISVLLISCTATMKTSVKETYKYNIEPYMFKTSGGDSIQAELGEFYVQENREKNTSKKIKLSFVRFKSTNPNPSAPIVYLAGGPGGSGISTARGPRYKLFLAMREIADVIAFDQRGTGLSHRLPGATVRWNFPLDEVGSKEKMSEYVQKAAAENAKIWKDAGVDLDAYNSNESADDLMDLRTVLGADKISLWSISYGTHLSFATVRRHEKHLHKLILAGIEGPAHTVKLPKDQQDILEDLNRRILLDEEAKKEYPDFLGDVKTVLDRLDKNPLTTEVTDPETNKKMTVTIGKFEMQMMTSWLLGAPGSSRRLPQIYKNMMNGNFDDFKSSFLDVKSGGFRAMSSAMDVASGISDERIALIKKQSSETLLGDAINFPFMATRAGLNVTDLGEEFRSPIKTDIPTLFISGTLDGRTAVANALDVIPGFSNSTHLILDGAGHSNPLFLSSPRILELMITFMKNNNVSDETITLKPIEFPIQKVVKVNSSILSSYEGNYQMGQGVMKVAKSDGNLSVSVPGRGTFIFYPKSDKDFYMNEADVTLKFVSKNQKVDHILLNFSGQIMNLKRLN